MTTIERLRLTVIEELIEGQINGTTAANRLNLSIRQVKRLKVKFKKFGHDGLIHTARGKQGLRKTANKPPRLSKRLSKLSKH